MHRLPSSSAVRRIRMAALLLCSRCLFAPAAAGTLAWSFVTGNTRLTTIGIFMLILAGLTVLLQWMIATRATCPLCMTPVLGTVDCMRHRSARTFMGSHRMQVAMTVLCLNRFQCPYCGESSVLKVRPRNR